MGKLRWDERASNREVLKVVRGKGRDRGKEREFEREEQKEKKGKINVPFRLLFAER